MKIFAVSFDTIALVCVFVSATPIPPPTECARVPCTESTSPITPKSPLHCISVPCGTDPSIPADPSPHIKKATCGLPKPLPPKTPP